MHTRLIAYEAMWSSDKLARCAPWAQPEYAWLYGLADARGCFEMTNLRVILGKVAAIRVGFTLELLERILAEFHANGLLFVWNQGGKLYGHWTNSKKKGRLPGPALLKRYSQHSAPPVPMDALAAYMEEVAQADVSAWFHELLNERSLTSHGQVVVLDVDLEVDRHKGTVKARKTKTATASPPQSVSAFDDFWKIYPRKEAKPRAVKA
jgi:hypothetical protein